MHRLPPLLVLIAAAAIVTPMRAMPQPLSAVALSALAPADMPGLDNSITLVAGGGRSNGGMTGGGMTGGGMNGGGMTGGGMNGGGMTGGGMNGGGMMGGGMNGGGMNGGGMNGGGMTGGGMTGGGINGGGMMGGSMNGGGMGGGVRGPGGLAGYGSPPAYGNANVSRGGDQSYDSGGRGQQSGKTYYCVTRHGRCAVDGSLGPLQSGATCGCLLGGAGKIQ